jgi:hypothetical protein
MSVRKTAAAITARLQEDAILNGSTFQGVVQNRPARYLSLFLSGGRREQSRFTGPSYTMVTHAVGTTPEQAQLVEERAQAKLIDWTPSVDGFQCRRIQHASSQGLEIDTDTSPPLYYLASSYSLTMEAVN